MIATGWEEGGPGAGPDSAVEVVRDNDVLGDHRL
jgi:hypothetical protein